MAFSLPLNPQQGTYTYGQKPMTAADLMQGIRGFSLSGQPMAAPAPTPAMQAPIMQAPAGSALAPVAANDLTGWTAPIVPTTETVAAGATNIANIDPAKKTSGFLRDAQGNLNLGNLETLTGMIGTLGTLYGAFQQHKLAKDSFNFQKDAYEKNMANQTKSYNTALEDRIKARYTQEGRSGADEYLKKHSL